MEQWILAQATSSVMKDILLQKEEAIQKNQDMRIETLMSSCIGGMSRQSWVDS
jgi:hypothetical protein